jgi:transposase
VVPPLRLLSCELLRSLSHLTLMFFKARELLVAQRTQLINALRGHLAEIGVIAAQGLDFRAQDFVGCVLEKRPIRRRIGDRQRIPGSRSWLTNTRPGRAFF